MKKQPLIQSDFYFPDRYFPIERIPHQRIMSFLRRILIILLVILIPLIYTSVAQSYQSLLQSFYRAPQAVRQSVKSQLLAKNTAYYWHITYTTTPNK